MDLFPSPMLEYSKALQPNNLACLPGNNIYLNIKNYCTQTTKLHFIFILFHNPGESRALGEIWQDLLDLFDCLPLAALINDRIFCCYGGKFPPFLKNCQQK